VLTCSVTKGGNEVTSELKYKWIEMKDTTDFTVV
jgi:hypothetical protein